MLEKNIEMIAKYLYDSVEKQTTQINAHYGLIGVSIFFLAYYKYSLEKKYLIKAQQLFEIITQVISKPSSKNFSYQNFIDYGKYLLFLKRNHYFDTNLNSILIELDSLNSHALKEFQSNNNYDLIGGALDVGQYLLRRSISEKLIHKTIVEIVNWLKEISFETKEKSLYWKSHFYDGKRVYLGLHGSAGIIVFLCKVFSKGICIDACKNVIVKATEFVLSNKLEGQNIFPPFINNSIKEYSLEYAYGDLYVGYSLYQAGIVLNKPSLLAESDSVFQNSFYFLKNNIFKSVRDSGLAYGIEGTYAIYNEMYDLTNCEKYMMARENCLKHSLFLNKFDITQEFLGYSPKLISFTPESQIGFINGLSGIGLIYICEISPEIDYYREFLHF